MFIPQNILTDYLQLFISDKVYQHQVQLTFKKV